MTALDVVFRLGRRPGPPEMRALHQVWEVYGIRKISFDGDGLAVRIEYDASRLCEKTIASLLRGAGLDVRERLDTLNDRQRSWR
ncbi:MAG TPA: hypothetical protein VE734_03565 [Terriglobales bacterium]|jgi:hypothetical protein|nr:hypothetical protein [Terriglobales bacterium]